MPLYRSLMWHCGIILETHLEMGNVEFGTGQPKWSGGRSTFPFCSQPLRALLTVLANILGLSMTFFSLSSLPLIFLSPSHLTWKTWNFSPSPYSVPWPLTLCPSIGLTPAVPQQCRLPSQPVSHLSCLQSSFFSWQLPSSKGLYTSKPFGFCASCFVFHFFSS